MKRFFSTKYNQNSLNVGLFILRVVLGILLMHHGYGKLERFSHLKDSFMSFMGMSSMISLSLIIFAELIGGLFLALGLFTRLMCIPIIIGMSVAAFIAKNGDVFGEAELPTMFLAAAAMLFLTGPGKYSLDKMVWK